MISNKTIIINWLLLILLTVISVCLGLAFDQPAVFIVATLVIVFVKGKQIIDVFMELQHAPNFWRKLLLSYVIIIPLVICVIYLL